MLRRRPILLAMLALVAPLPALAMSGEPDDTGGPAALSVSTSLDSCGVVEADLVCKLDVSWNTIAEADSYTASVTRADGSVVDYGSVGAGGTSLYVPYVGSGTYSVRITAYGTPEEPGEQGEEIATEVSDAKAEDEPEVKTGTAEAEADATAEEPSAREPEEGELDDGTTDGEIEAEPICEPEPTVAPQLPPVPVAPPEDLDPADPDEDADGLPDAEELAEYERLLAEREQALAEAEQAQVTDPAC